MTTKDIIPQIFCIVHDEMKEMPKHVQARRLLEQAKPLLPLVERVITQTRTRVLESKKVASGKTRARGSLSRIPAPFLETFAARWSNLASM
jgi:hypothetical protein